MKKLILTTFSVFLLFSSFSQKAFETQSEHIIFDFEGNNSENLTTIFTITNNYKSLNIKTLIDPNTTFTKSNYNISIHSHELTEGDTVLKLLCIDRSSDNFLKLPFTIRIDLKEKKLE